MTDPHDELEALLAPGAASENDAAMRAAIFRRTQLRLALHRWSRRAGRAAAVAVVFLAGVGVGAWRTPAPIVRQPEVVVEVVLVPVPVFVPVAGGATEHPQMPEAPVTAARLELDAEQADDATLAAKLYRQAGDRYLTGEQDYANAARCYRLFLSRAGDPALSPEPADSWLLTSLKTAAFKEKIDAKTNNG